MFNRDPGPETPRPETALGEVGRAPHAPVGERVSAVRRGFRWANLTLLQHGVWPLLVVVWGAPAGPVPTTPLPWYWARLAAPALAAALALAYVARRREWPPRSAAVPGADARDGRDKRLREQATILIVGVTAAVAILRLVAGPFAPVLKLEAFGLAQVAAYQTICFGVAGRFATAGAQAVLPVALFGLSWGLQEVLGAAASPRAESLILSFAVGATLGLAFGGLSLGLRRWPGGFAAAAALHFLLVYLVFGFVRG